MSRSREEYEDLIDAREHAVAMAAHARGEDPGLTDAEMDAYLAARPHWSIGASVAV